VLRERGIVDIGRLGPGRWPTLRAALEAGALEEVRRLAETVAPSIDPARVELDVPVPDADAFWCAGRNYRDHVAEMDAAAAQQPSIFIRTRASLCAHGQPVVRPKISTNFDYEGELALVFGKRGRAIAKGDALSYIAGYSCFLDGSIRDWQKHSVTAGKNFWRSGGFGPWLVTADEVGDPTKLTLETRVSGERRQHSTTDLLIFDIPTLIAYVSAIAEVRPGDVLATGTPSGVAAGMKPPRWLAAGDTVEVEISKVGTLRHTIVDEQR